MTDDRPLTKKLALGLREVGERIESASDKIEADSNFLEADSALAESASKHS